MINFFLQYTAAEYIMYHRFLKKETLVAEKCDLVDTCPFFNIFGTFQYRLRQEYAATVCTDKANCKRIEFIKESGKQPPDNMSPTGRLV